MHKTAGGDLAGLVRLQSVQATRRAVLHVQAAGDPPVPSEVTNWFTERGFHFYVAAVRLPLPVALSARVAERDLRPAFADLDTAYGCLREPDGMVSVIVTAQGRGAFAAAAWSATRESRDPQYGVGRRTRADALILSGPVWPPRGDVCLDIPCPVLVIDRRDDGGSDVRAQGRALAPGRLGQGGRRQRRRGQPGVPAMALGSHVTWLTLTGADAGHRVFLTELGRWLGAYMYPGRDRLL
jgi:hypothetical protein